MRPCAMPGWTYGTAEGFGGSRALVPWRPPSDPLLADLEPYIWKTTMSRHTVHLFTVF